MQSLQLTQKILLLNTEQKDRVNVYTFVNLDTNETQTVVGVKLKMPLHIPLEANITMRITRENFELKDGTRKYVNITNMFITDIKEV